MMKADYRRTIYEGNSQDYSKNKCIVESLIKAEHPKAIDMHRYLKKNDGPFKLPFIRAYGGKCSYCGVSIKVVDKQNFEIDHFIPVTDSRFESKSKAGTMENLVLACRFCNRNKHEYLVTDDYVDRLHPDKEGITSTFYRDDMYYIRVSKNWNHDMNVSEFYQTLKMDDEMHRLDYLLMNLIGLQAKCSDNEQIRNKIGYAVQLLLSKRNIGGIK